MKNILFLLCTGLASLTTQAQDSTATRHLLKTYDELLPRFCVDLNFKYGTYSGSPTFVDMNTTYPRVITSLSSIQPVKISNTNTTGGDLQLGYFFGRKHNIGIGAGVLYSSTQNYNVSMGAPLHLEFQSTDGLPTHDVFRQLITADGPITENVKTTSLSIPILAKFKHQFSKEWGIFADAGPMFSVMSTSKTTTNASFDYEAIYQYSGDGSGVYDGNSTPGKNDWLITKKAFEYNNGSTSIPKVDSYFNTLKSLGYNVGLNQSPSNKSRTTHYDPFAIGFLVQAGVSYQLNYRITANIGGYYSYQTFMNSKTDGYQITNTVGSYNSLTDGIKQVNVQSYGITVGIRYFIGAPRDIDGDGVPDKVDECPLVFGLAEFNGCPDTDGDGVPDKEDRCPYEKGTKQTAGCPDRDGDGVPDDIDHCPDQPGSWTTGGCPDRDGDGVADDDDLCPDVFGLKKFHGCPTDSSLRTSTMTMAGGTAPTISYQPSHIELSKSVINFEYKKADISDSDYPTLDEVADHLKKDPSLIVYISGHTDDVGSYQTNMMLSFARAEMVQKYLVYKGISKSRVIISGMGKSDPIIANDTPENRAKNRRIEMRLLMPISK
jgi:outer membrane protein OmpA-like peptidoglycan-associated protein